MLLKKKSRNVLKEKSVKYLKAIQFGYKIPLIFREQKIIRLLKGGVHFTFYL
jgi:hypothetical protein